MNSIKPLLYFSLFKYPLSAKEVYLFSTAANKDEIVSELTYLESKGVVASKDDFYYLNNDISSIDRRHSGNKMAASVMDKAIKKGVFISKFPFVTAVGISGSLSKNYHDEHSDVDFFVITKSNRLWVCRTLLMLYKKIFLFNSRKFFCVNYFIDENNLEITEKNIFTATELLTLIPICGKFDEFYKKNTWVANFLPNMKIGKSTVHPIIHKNWFSKSISFLLNTRIGDVMDVFFLKVTLKKWNIKFNNLSKEEFDVAMKSTSGVSKHHPKNFQKKVIDRLHDSYDTFQSKHNITLEKKYA